MEAEFEAELETELDLNPQFINIAKHTEAILSEGREDRAQKKKNQQEVNLNKRKGAEFNRILLKRIECLDCVFSVVCYVTVSD